MRKIFSFDRVEGEYAVCISDDDDKVDVPLDFLHGLKQNDIFSAELCDGSLSDIVPMPEERDRRLKKNRERLTALFDRGKKELK